MNLLANFLACKPCGQRLVCDVTGYHALRRCQSAQQVVALGIRRFLHAQPPACIAFTGQQHIRKTLRLAKGVAALEQAHQSPRTDSGAGVNVAVLTCHHVGQLFAVHWHTQPLAHLFGQPGAAVLMANMARQNL